MIIIKITPGFVSQIFDTERGGFVEQSFIASDEVSYETTRQDQEGDWIDEAGKKVSDPGSLIPEGTRALPFEMVQPEEAFCAWAMIPELEDFVIGHPQKQLIRTVDGIPVLFLRDENGCWVLHRNASACDIKKFRAAYQKMREGQNDSP